MRHGIRVDARDEPTSAAARQVRAVWPVVEAAGRIGIARSGRRDVPGA
jgi:hypothetical protein